MASIELPLRAKLLALHRRGDREVRRAQGELDGRAKDRALLAPQRRRMGSGPMIARSVTLMRTHARIALLLLLTVLVAVACGDASVPSASVAPTPHPPLVPASPGADPFSLLAWLFTPVFQALFIGLVALDNLTGDIGISILLLTVVIRIVLISPYRRQLVSQKRTQMLAPEVEEIKRRYKGDRMKIQQAQAELYKTRGINPLSGCLPTLLQFIVLIPMYTVISNGLTNPDPTGMLSVFGAQILTIDCVNGLGTAAYDNMKPCMEAVVPWLGGLDASKPWAPISLIGIGISPLALASALLQVVQTRMTLPKGGAAKGDPAAAMQSQTLVILPLISILYGGILPAGLFIYWIASTVFSLAQQYLILGYGGLFPLFGWNPAFAANHAPRFPVAMPESAPAGDVVEGAPQSRTELDRAASAAATIRSAKKRDRHGRRGGR
jgi:YidC/Oxa1 family membrane protein insertase